VSIGTGESGSRNRRVECLHSSQGKERDQDNLHSVWPCDLKMALYKPANLLFASLSGLCWVLAHARHAVSQMSWSSLKQDAESALISGTKGFYLEAFHGSSTSRSALYISSLISVADSRKRRNNMSSPTRHLIPEYMCIIAREVASTTPISPTIMTPSSKDARTPQCQAIGVVSPTMCINVGSAPDDKEFFVHQDLICSRSELFDSTIGELRKEVPSHKIDLGSEKPETFAVYLCLLYVCISNLPWVLFQFTNG
jgi:hypothetical protein